MLQFRIDCIPPKATAQASTRILKRKDGSQFVGKFANSKAKKAQDDLLVLLQPHRPEKPLKGPLLLSIIWVYPWRKSEPKKNRVSGLLDCYTRPDCDNLAKMFQDCLTRLAFFGDDSQVSRLYFAKFWGDHPGISVTLTDADGTPGDTTPTGKRTNLNLPVPPTST